MNSRRKSRRILWFIIILALGVIFTVDFPGTASNHPPADEVAGRIDNSEEDGNFIKSRNTVTYTLSAAAKIGDILKMFRLRLKKVDVEALNPNLPLESDYLETEIPRGGMVKLSIRARLNRG